MLSSIVIVSIIAYSIYNVHSFKLSSTINRLAGQWLIYQFIWCRNYPGSL